MQVADVENSNENNRKDGENNGQDANPLAAILCLGGTACGAFLCAFVPAIVILALQISALNGAGKDFPSSLFTFEMNPDIPRACQKIFNVMNCTVIMCFLGMLVSSLNFCVTSASSLRQAGSEAMEGSNTQEGFAMTNGYAPVEGYVPPQSPMAQCSSCVLNCVRIGQSCVGIWGFVVTIFFPEDHHKDCERLYNIAWWTYVGLPLIGLILACCVVPVVLFTGAGAAMLLSEPPAQQGGGAAGA